MPWGVYVHVPWCRVRCPYCAFHVERDDGAVPWEAWLAAVRRDRDHQAPAFSGTPHTVYLGGGTPSRLPLPTLRALLDALVAPGTVEVTLEANPEDIDPDWLAAVVDAGVDRLSLGVQTLSEAHARRLGRAHTPAEARAALAWVPHHVRTWSVDLMFGLPDQSLDDLQRDLDALLAAEPPHVSLYGLTIEPGTPYARAASAGRLQPADDDRWRAMMERIVGTLQAAGLERYEVSNFARPGHTSVHNQGYWEGRPYMGLGPSAHALLPDGTRLAGPTDTAGWLTGDAPHTVEHPTPHQRAVDRLVGGLRGVDGVAHAELSALGWVPDARAIRQLVAAGLLADDPRRTRLAPEGFYVADGVVRALVRALQPVPAGLAPVPPRG